jgi:large conductance mechanosensitive channel
VFEFFIIAVCIFFLVKVVTSMRLSQPAPPAPPAAPTKSEELLSEIRDLLKNQDSR